MTFSVPGSGAGWIESSVRVCLTATCEEVLPITEEKDGSEKEKEKKKQGKNKEFRDLCEDTNMNGGKN